MIAKLNKSLDEPRASSQFVSAPRRDLYGMVINKAAPRRCGPPKKKGKGSAEEFELKSDSSCNDVNAEYRGNKCAQKKIDLAEACKRLLLS